MNQFQVEQPRPRFKGVLHAILAIYYLYQLPKFLTLIPTEISGAIYLYLFGLIGHLVASATLHLIPWSKDKENFWRRIDHSMIFIYIYASYHATIVTVIPFVNSLVNYFLHIGTILGICMRLFFTDLHPMLIGTPYLMVGWSILLDPYAIIYGFQHLTEAATLCLMTGLTYSIGTVIYIIRWPNPCPRYMGFHEIFHIFSGIGTILLTSFIFQYCIPHYTG